MYFIHRHIGFNNNIVYIRIMEGKKKVGMTKGFQSAFFPHLSHVEVYIV